MKWEGFIEAVKGTQGAALTVCYRYYGMAVTLVRGGGSLF